MHFPNISPVALELGPLVIRWYALAYVVGILLAQWLLVKLDDSSSTRAGEGRDGGATRDGKASIQSNTPPPTLLPQGGRVFHPTPLLSKAARDDLILYGVLGILLGGRLGYVLFYNLPYYLAHPTQILHVWQGGMAFHGGLIGVTLAFLVFARKHRIPFFALMDRIAVVAPIGLLLGRLANFINGELYGRVTTMPWGVIFPNGGPLPRHPSQLYEAALEGLVLFIILWRAATKTSVLKKPGMLAGLFLIGYALSRIVVEFFREPDAQLGFLFAGLTMGQLLSAAMLLVGMWALRRA